MVTMTELSQNEYKHLMELENEMLDADYEWMCNPDSRVCERVYLEAEKRYLSYCKKKGVEPTCLNGMG